MAENFRARADFIWSVADLLRGDFKQSQYGRVILPFTLLRRMECVLEPTAARVREVAAANADKPEVVVEKLLRRGAARRVMGRFNRRPWPADAGTHGWYTGHP